MGSTFRELRRLFPGLTVEVVCSDDNMHVDGGFELAKERGTLTRDIKSCTSCGLHANCLSPVPFNGPSNALLAFMGEAPGPTENRMGEPFVGKSGRLLGRILDELGVDMATDCIRFNTVSCFPNANTKIRPPTDDEMVACRGNMVKQRQAAHCKYIVLVGSTALSAFRDDLKISRVHGRVYIWDNTWVVMPIYHPAKALRERGIREDIVEDLAKFILVAKGEMSWQTALSYECSLCQEWIHYFDPNGVGYCKKHWELDEGRLQDEWRRNREQWTDKGKERLGNTLPTILTDIPSIAVKRKAKRNSSPRQSESLFE